jgi:hypothetical protein
VSTVLREGCGTYLGLRLHQAAGEQPCSECLRNEAYRRVEHEGIPFRLPRPDVLAPVTAEQAARNLDVLARALREAARERKRELEAGDA